MQYLLTSDEYLELRYAQQEREKKFHKELLDFCIYVAENMDYKREHSGFVGPHGCILSETNVAGYCSDCPCSTICPSEHKEWEK